jgi:ribosomal-protein-alanine N-acetyltransferase
MIDDVARQENISTVFLEVRESNLPARALYEQIGFEALAVRKDYYPAKDGREHAVVMKKNLALGN